MVTSFFANHDFILTKISNKSQYFSYKAKKIKLTASYLTPNVKQYKNKNVTFPWESPIKNITKIYKKRFQFQIEKKNTKKKHATRLMHQNQFSHPILHEWVNCHEKCQPKFIGIKWVSADFRQTGD